MKKYTYVCPDYEHSGDLDRDIAYIKKEIPEAINIRGWEERDYEAESDYDGELDEPIYQGYISFEAPEEVMNKIDYLDIF